MFNFLANCAWFIFFLFSIFANTIWFIIWLYTKLWYIMSSKKFDLTPKQKKDISTRVRETIKKSPYKTMNHYAVLKGLSPNTLHNWAKKGHINTGFLVMFSEEFRLSLDWLIKGKSGPTSETE